MSNSQDFVFDVLLAAGLQEECDELNERVERLSKENVELLSEIAGLKAENRGLVYCQGQLEEFRYENVRLAQQLEQANDRAAELEEELRKAREELTQYRESDPNLAAVLRQPVRVLGSMQGMGYQLERHGIKTLGDLVATSPQDLMRWHHVGKGRAKMVNDTLAAYGDERGLELSLAP